MKTLRKTSRNRRSRIHSIATIEQLSSEIFFDIFDYLTGNQIYKSFFGLNSRFNELVYNTPNVHLNLSRNKTKFYSHFHQIFPEQNIVSIVLLYKNVNLLETLFNSTGVRRLKTISLLAVPVRAFEIRIPGILSIFKHQLNSLKIGFSDMQYTETGVYAAQSFGYLLTKLPLLKHLTLEYPSGIDQITFIPSVFVNNTIISLTMSLDDLNRLIPLLYRFEKLKMLTIHYYSNPIRKRAAPRDALAYYRSQLREKTSIDYPTKVRHINVYNYGMILNKVEHLFKLVISPSLLTLSLFTCERPAVRHPLPRRTAPFLDGIHWHDLLKQYLPSTMKQFYIEYQDVDYTMSIKNLLQVKKEFIKYSRLTSLWDVSCSYDQDKNLLSFNFSIIKQMSIQF